MGKIETAGEARALAVKPITLINQIKKEIKYGAEIGRSCCRWACEDLNLRGM